MPTDSRTGEDRRKAPRSERGRRASDPIADLRTHPAKWVDVTQALDYINREVCPLSRQTLYKWVQCGTLESVRVTREIRISTDSLRRFLLNQLRRPA